MRLLLWGASAAFPKVPLLESTPAMVRAPALPAPDSRMFWMVMLLAPFPGPALRSQTQTPPVLVLMMVMFWANVAAEREPSMVTLSAPFRVMRPLLAADAPEMMRSPPLGLMSTAKPPGSSFERHRSRLRRQVGDDGEHDVAGGAAGVEAGEGAAGVGQRGVVAAAADVVGAAQGRIDGEGPRDLVVGGVLVAGVLGLGLDGVAAGGQRGGREGHRGGGAVAERSDVLDVVVDLEVPCIEDPVAHGDVGLRGQARVVERGLGREGDARRLESAVRRDPRRRWPRCRWRPGARRRTRPLRCPG